MFTGGSWIPLTKCQWCRAWVFCVNTRTIFWTNIRIIGDLRCLIVRWRYCSVLLYHINTCPFPSSFNADHFIYLSSWSAICEFRTWSKLIWGARHVSWNTQGLQGGIYLVLLLGHASSSPNGLVIMWNTYQSPSHCDSLKNESCLTTYPFSKKCRWSFNEITWLNGFYQLGLRCLKTQVQVVLTHWGRDKWTPFGRRHFQVHLLEWKWFNSY